MLGHSHSFSRGAAFSSARNAVEPDSKPTTVLKSPVQAELENGAGVAYQDEFSGAFPAKNGDGRVFMSVVFLGEVQPFEPMKRAATRLQTALGGHLAILQLKDEQRHSGGYEQLDSGGEIPCLWATAQLKTSSLCSTSSAQNSTSLYSLETARNHYKKVIYFIGYSVRFPLV